MACSNGEDFHELAEYKPPTWCNGLKVIPKHRIRLAMRPTPIHRWKIQEVPDDFQIYVKRDDLTGSSLSGNKARKLEFILADAKTNGYTDVITSGSTRSNHSRATVLAARQIGLDCHLILRDGEQNCRTATPSGNFLLMEAGEPNIYLMPWTSFADQNVVAKGQILKNKIQETPGRKVYFIPPGGDTPLGVFGYIDAWDELMKQNVHERFDDVVVTTGSSGTICGLAIGNYLTGSKLRIHALSVSRKEKIVNDLINEKLRSFGVEGVQVKDILHYHDYLGKGYSILTKEDTDFCKHIVKTTGICCDPVYVGKALRALLKDLHENPGQFKGKRILFVHTGGIFGLIENHIGRVIHDEKAVGRIKDWEDAFPGDKEETSTNS